MTNPTTTQTTIACPDQNMVVLIANRGEIARRIIRTLDTWDVESVAVYADPDADAPHVSEATRSERIGPAALDESYLSIDAILAAAERSGATHVHPGYGFLSERTEFAEAVTAAGLTWIGPSPASVASMGSKIEARTVASTAGVPVIPGFNQSQEVDALSNAANTIGYPVLVKASAGGGGKGIRIANTPDDFESALRDAKAESLRSFGNDDVIVERYITRPRHIEVQVAGDKHGTVIDVGTRECSVQRRYQKVLEEAPAPSLPADVSDAIRQAAVNLTKDIGYDSVGTIEFIVDAATNEFFFLEMNTRIQVEHTVTEQVTGLDLIALQLAISCGEPIALSPTFFDDALGANPKHSIEARITAENAWEGHLPQTGTVTALNVPEGDHIRWDAAIVEGSEISPFYDSMIGKLIITADSRGEALDLLDAALGLLNADGLTTNASFHRWLISRSEVRTSLVTTRFLDETDTPTHSPFDQPVHSPWASKVGFRVTPHNSILAFESSTRDGSWDNAVGSGDAGADVRAPFPGLVTEILVATGDTVSAGQALLTIEAMKMLHPVIAGGDTKIATVEVVAGEQVEGGAVLITFSPTESEKRDRP